LAPYQAFVEERVAQNPNITLYELRDALMKAEGIRVHHSSISALLSRLGFTYKKNRWRQPSAGRKSKTGAARRATVPHADYAASN
jgi:transposase